MREESSVNYFSKFRLITNMNQNFFAIYTFLFSIKCMPLSFDVQTSSQEHRTSTQWAKDHQTSLLQQVQSAHKNYPKHEK